MPESTTEQTLQRLFAESRAVQEQTLARNRAVMIEAVEVLAAALRQGNKILIFGNGGSAADSQHMAAELIGRFQAERRSLPALALTTDSSALTALGNDYGFETVFARQLSGLGRAGDVAVAISTSGNAANVLRAVEEARTMGLRTIALTGGSGGRLAPLVEIPIIVASSVTARIQESHICVIHALCHLVEQQFLTTEDQP